MKAAVVEALGVITVKDVADPQLIAGSLRIRVEACAVCGSDIRIFRKGDPRATLPRIIGHEIAGVVEAIGEGTAGFAVGDRVTVAPGPRLRSLPLVPRREWATSASTRGRASGTPARAASPRSSCPP